MCLTLKIKLRNLRWVPNSIATQLPSAHGAGLTHCPIGHLWRAVSQGGSAVLAALSKKKSAQTFVALSVRREQSKRGSWGGALQGNGKYSKLPYITAISTPKERAEPCSRQAHYPTLQRGLVLNIWKRIEWRYSTGSIPQGTHLPRMPDLCHLSGHTSVNTPSSLGQEDSRLQGPLPPPISAHLSTCVDAEQTQQRDIADTEKHSFLCRQTPSLLPRVHFSAHPLCDWLISGKSFQIHKP